MKSNLVSACILTAAGLMSVNSFADTGDSYPSPRYEKNNEPNISAAPVTNDGSGRARTDAQGQPSSTGKTRAEVRAELDAVSPRPAHWLIQQHYPFVR